MLDDLLNIGCAFDWITPALAFLDDWRYGPAAHFGIPALCGFDRRDIRRVLEAGGVRVWGLMWNTGGDMIMFAVNERQAKWARYLLEQAGIPLWYVPESAVGKS